MKKDSKHPKTLFPSLDDLNQKGKEGRYGPELIGWKLDVDHSPAIPHSVLRRTL